MGRTPLVLDGQPLSISDVSMVARHGQPVRVGEDAIHRLQAARAVIEAHLNDGQPHYGINTGFGSLSRVRIPADQLREVQRNLIRSHAAGVGQPLPDDVVRAMMLILAASLCRGHSGVRVEVVETLVGMLNAEIMPHIPSRGSVGASGDLAPLAHLGLAMIGEADVYFEGVGMKAEHAFHNARLKLKNPRLQSVTLEAKEGLAIINGTHLMCAIGSLALADTHQLEQSAIASAAMAIDACRATDAFLDDRLHIARNQPGQRRVASQLRELLDGSTILPAHRENDPRVQDPYCLRATPQVLGAAIDTVAHARQVIENELGAVTDNPLVFTDKRLPFIVSGGNFHGMPLAIALDTLKIALCHVAGIAERRINWLLTASDSENPVNVYLSPQPGLHSGMMIVQYTAAACCNELQTLAHPASVHNIPTSAGIEDYNSMGATSAHQLRAVVDLCTNVIACELLVMAEAMEYQRPLRSGHGVERAYATVRSKVQRLVADRPPAPDIGAIAKLIRDGAF